MNVDSHSGGPGTAPRRVLMLAYFFPPMAVSGAVRPAAFCRHLAEFGYGARVLSTHLENVHPPLQADPGLLSLVPADVRVERLDYRDKRRLLLDVRARLRPAQGPRPPAGAAAVATPAATARAGASGLRAALGRLVTRLFMFPDQQKDWGPAVLRRVRALTAAERPHVVYATGTPWSALVTGAAVAKWLDVPFVADFRDPWTQNLKRGFTPDLHERAARLEREVLAGATRVIANTPALREHFARYSPDIAQKTVCITNGIHELLRSSMAVPAEAQTRAARVELCYFGTVSKARVPRALLQALHGLLAEGRLTRGQLCLRFTGNWTALDADTSDSLAMLEQAGVLQREPAVPYEQCIRQMKGSDYLLVLQQGYPLQVPAKIYEYMATGRPVVVIGGEGATAEVVEAGRFGLVCPDEPAAIRAVLLRLMDDALAPAGAADEILARYDYRALTGQLAGVFDAAIAEYART